MASRILIVDDEPSARETLVSILEPNGYELKLSEDGLKGLDQAELFEPDVILLDVMMPGMDGFEVCEKIRNNPKTAEIPILFLTAAHGKTNFMRGLEVGGDGYLTKPVDRMELRARLAGILRLNRYRKLQDERANVEKEHQNLLAAYDATIEGWSRAMDLRDKETEGHTQRVTALTLEIGELLGMHEQQLLQMRRGALLHDMGKLGIPDEILFKPGKFTPEEWEIMKQHPQFAYDMLSPIKYLKDALEIPFCHHEKWDGSGYPRGLKGQEIPLSARIFAVVDVWDALTSDRPYRKAWTEKKTLEHIISNAGTHFDPAIVKLFVNIIKAKLCDGQGVLNANTN